jgi:hypothetical protein
MISTYEAGPMESRDVLPLLVHVLVGGWPLCGFSRDVPGSWPAGHRWVRVGEPEANCPACLKRAGLVFR